MKNFVRSGETISVTAPYAVTGGAGVLVGSIFGVAYADAGNGEAVQISTTGVFNLKTKSTDTPAQGALAYWDNTNKEVTTTATANTKIGVFALAKNDSGTTGTVRLNGAF